jgi:hypothetical protein
MALKRINKELTDLGRYVDPFDFTLFCERINGGAANEAGCITVSR